MARRVSLPERGISSEDAGLASVIDPRDKSGSVSSDDGDGLLPKQGRFFKTLTRSLNPAVVPPKKKDYLEEYQRYKAKRAFNLHGVVKQQTIDLGTLGLSDTSEKESDKSRRFSTGAHHHPQSQFGAESHGKGSTLPVTSSHSKRGPPPPVAPRKKSVNLPVIREPPSPTNKVSSAAHDTPAYILSAMKKEQQRAEVEARKAAEASDSNERKEEKESTEKNMLEYMEGTPTEHGVELSTGGSTEAACSHVIERSITEEVESSQAEQGGSSCENENADQMTVSEPHGADVGRNQELPLENEVGLGGDECKKDQVDEMVGWKEEAVKGQLEMAGKDVTAEVKEEMDENEEGVTQEETKVVSDEAREAEEEGKGIEELDQGQQEKHNAVGKGQDFLGLEVHEAETKQSVSGSAKFSENESESVGNDCKSEKSETKESEKKENVIQGSQEKIDEGTAPHGMEGSERKSEDVIKTDVTNVKVVLTNGNEIDVVKAGSGDENSEGSKPESSIKVEEVPSKECTKISGEKSDAQASNEKLSKTADLLLSFSQDKKDDVVREDSDLAGIGEELKKLNLSIEELSQNKTKEEKASGEDVEKLNALETMRSEMEIMQKEMDLFG